MATAEDVLESKGFDVYTIDPNRTVFEAIAMMDRLQSGSLVVVSEGSVIGVLTERDYLRKVALCGRTSRTTLVGDIMSTPAITVDVEATVEHCMSVMTRARSRHLPVMSGGRLVGLISLGDLVKWRLREKDAEIASIISYVQTGSAVWLESPGSLLDN